MLGSVRLFSFALALTACTSPATQVTIVVGSDAPLDRALHVTATVSLPSSAQPSTHTWLAGGARPEIVLPASFAIVPATGDVASQRVLLDLQAVLDAGEDGAPAIQFHRIARFGFTRGRATSIRIFLPVSCGAVTTGCAQATGDQCTAAARCAEMGQTCGNNGECVAPDVEPTTPTGTEDLVCGDPLANDAPRVLVPDAPTVPLATQSTVGYRSAAGLAVVSPGANGTTSAIEISATSGAVATIEQGSYRAYLDGTSAYRANGPNAIEFYAYIPAGSPAASVMDSQRTTISAYHWRPGDARVGTSPGVGPVLQSSAQHEFAFINFDPAAIDRWMRVVLTADAFRQRYSSYHYLASQGGAEDLAFVPSIRALAIDPPAASTGAFRFDEVRTITLPETARVCPSYSGLEVTAADRDVAMPIEIVNPTDRARRYHVFVSSVVGVDRATSEAAEFASGDETASTVLSDQLGSDGGVFVAELFAADAQGQPTGPSIVRAAGEGIAIAAHGRWRGVVVHHVVASMLGPAMPVTYGAYSATVRRDTLTTSLIVWDPTEPALSDPGVIYARSNADSIHSGVFLPTQVTELPAGWRSADLRGDQATGHFVSIIHLRP